MIPKITKIAILTLAVIAVLLLGVLAWMMTPRLTQPEETAVITEPPTTVPPTTLLALSPYTMRDFQYSGKYMTCLAGPSALGIDVSSHQQQIDWEQVAGAGVEFVMIRAGYRGYGQAGTLNADIRAQENYEGARAAGLKVGAYFFSQAISVDEAQEELAFFLEIIQDWELDLPIVLDWEYISQDARTAHVNRGTVSACLRLFTREAAALGYTPMVYFNPNHARRFIDLPSLRDYPFWLAYYTDRMTYTNRVHLWQYTNEGSVPGIGTPVDLNLWLGELP